MCLTPEGADVSAVVPSRGRPLARPRLCGRLGPAVHGGGPAGDPERQQPEADCPELLLGLAGPVLLVLVRTLHPVLQHMEGAGTGCERYRCTQARLGSVQSVTFSVSSPTSLHLKY